MYSFKFNTVLFALASNIVIALCAQTHDVVIQMGKEELKAGDVTLDKNFMAFCGLFNSMQIVASDFQGKGGNGRVFKATVNVIRNGTSCWGLFSSEDVTPHGEYQGKSIAVKISTDKKMRSSIFETLQKIPKETSQLSSILGIGTLENGHSFMLCEMCEGGTLKDFLTAKGPMGDILGSLNRLECAKAVGNGILNGLKKMHSKGLAHTDISKGNIMFSEQHELKLGCDFSKVREYIRLIDLDSAQDEIGIPLSEKEDHGICLETLQLDDVLRVAKILAEIIFPNKIFKRHDLYDSDGTLSEARELLRSCFEDAPKDVVEAKLSMEAMFSGKMTAANALKLPFFNQC